MKLLYLLLDVATIFFPLILSFDKKVTYFKQWKFVFLAGLIVGIPFLVWDYLFTASGFWGFNPDYLCGFYLLNLPLEEVLFFVVVPFACLFIYVCVKTYFAQINFIKLNVLFYVLLAGYIGFIAAFGYSGAYAQLVVCSSVVTLIFIWVQRKYLHFLPVAFLISLIPFLLVNGILTGAFTAEPTVWYNDLERTPFRIFTIPAEDILYSFTLMGLNVWVYEWVKGSVK